LISNALKKFRSTTNPNNYYLTVTPLDKNDLVEERRLLPTENINKVLDSFGVMSYLSIERRRDGKKATSRVNQADGTIKITLYSHESPLIGVRVCFDNGNGINRWEKVEFREMIEVDELVEKVVGVFGVSKDGGFKLFSLATKEIVNQDNFVKMVKVAQEKGQVLTLKLANEGRVPKSRLDPGRKTLDPGRISLDPGRISLDPGLEPTVISTPDKETPISTLFNSAATSIDKQIIGFEELLSTLETSIAEQSKLDTGLHKMFDTLEKDLESLISTQMRKNAEQRRSGRLSMMMIQKEKQDVKDIDPAKFFAGLKETSSTLSRLEGNLNNMLNVILARNNLIDVS
jgi:hypothetical protein